MIGSMQTLGILGQGLEYAALRHETLADNLSNVDTPNFKRNEVSFPSLLARALDESDRLELKTSSPRHYRTQPLRDPSQVRPRLFSEVDTSARNDGNNVNFEVEATNLAQNTLYYQTIAQRVRDRYRILSDTVRRAGQAG